MRILLAEDDQTSRSFMSKYLSRYGQCDIVVNGLDAINKLETAIENDVAYDLICLDVMMPKIDGIKALSEIRKLESKKGNKNKKAVIIMTTALNDKVTVKDAYDAGCDAYAWKPINIKEFNVLLEELGLI